MESKKAPAISSSSVLLSGYSSKIRLSPFGAAVVSGLVILATVTVFGGLAYEKTITSLSESKDAITQLRSTNAQLVAENSKLKEQANQASSEKSSSVQIEKSNLALIHASAAKIQTTFGAIPGFKSEPYKSWSTELSKEINEHYTLISKEMGDSSK